MFGLPETYLWCEEGVDDNEDGEEGRRKGIAPFDTSVAGKPVIGEV